MSDEIWERDEIDSPCVKICVIHEGSGLCMGCYRTRPEIAGWSRMTPELRKDLIVELPSRASQVKGKRRTRRR